MEQTSEITVKVAEMSQGRDGQNIFHLIAGLHRRWKSIQQEGAATEMNGSDSSQSDSLTCEKDGGGREQKSKVIGRASEGISED